MSGDEMRLTARAPGGGCSCKVAPGQLEAWLALAYSALEPTSSPLADLLCGLESGDDATVVRLGGGTGAEGTAIVTTTDFFPPVVDDPYDWGRIAATNAISDVYAMGGEPVSALNLLALPGDLPDEVAVEVLRGGRAVADEAPFVLAGGHTIVADTPLYGLAVTGVADPGRLLRNDAARAGVALTLTKPLGVGILNNWHKATGEPIGEAVATMTRSNRDASRAALAAGIAGATDVTGFGLLGHLYKMARASGVTAVVDAAAVPYLDGARRLLEEGYVPGGTRRNLDWVRPALDASCDETELLLLADAQTSGGLLLAGELPSDQARALGAVVIGELVPAASATVVVR
ncbi:MAG TPA: selenide, water dikinase SelD [Acidimicrobiales bacterium]|nr:selenide, water dikinase SelD [Acidimicrobiales bacterium]